MKNKLLALVAVALIGAGVAVWLVSQREPPPPGTGIPLGLAESRASRVSALKYQVTLGVPTARTEPVRGNLVATFTLSSARAPLAFDFAQPADKLVSVFANGQDVAARIIDGHIVIPPSRLVAGENTIEFEFIAGDGPLNRQDEFLYSLFVPARASLALPCFDLPDL